MRVAYLAVDLETTGLDPHGDAILEIAWAPLSESFERMAPTKSLVLEVTDLARECLMANEYTRNMHTANGLTREALDGGIPLAVVEKVVMADADTWEWADTKLTVLGSSVHFDLSFIQAHMPQLAKWLHYRVLDVTTLISFATAAGAYRDDRQAIAHRAAADIDWSIGTAQSIFASLGGRAAVAA